MGSTPALQRVRRLLRAAKAGHAGTLDPMATGMLPLCFGQATKACGQLLGSAKAYRARLVLGAATDTADADGQVVRTGGLPEVDLARLEAVLGSPLGVVRATGATALPVAATVASIFLYSIACPPYEWASAAWLARACSQGGRGLSARPPSGQCVLMYSATAAASSARTSARRMGRR